MKSRIRAVASMVALGGIVFLGGCVAYPAGGTYDAGYGYGGYGSGYGYGGDPYYSNPVVVSPSVYVQGGRSYDNRGYYDRRPDYRGDDRPRYNGRPDRNAGRPGRPEVQPPRPQPARPRSDGLPPSSVAPRAPNAPPTVQPNGQYMN